VYLAGIFSGSPAPCSFSDLVMLRAVNVNYLSLYTAATKWEINRLLRHLRLDDAELTAAAAAAAADDVVLTRDNSDGVFGVDNNSEQLSG